MLTLLLGTDWVANSDDVLRLLSQDVRDKRAGRVLIVPELISHETERRLCKIAGNTSCRFAEVLTFTRLVHRVAEAIGCPIPDCMDDGGRIVAMACAARQLHSKLKAYAAIETKPEFLKGLLDAVDEFKRCCISPADLLEASHRTEGAFAQKLEELSLILDTYDSLCAQSKSDPRDLMNWLLEQLEDCDYANRHVFYIDGFPDFTSQHLAIVGHLLSNAKDVTISLNCDCVDSVDPSFEKASDTARQILALARKYGIETQIRYVPSREDGIRTFCSKLFRGKVLPVTEGESFLHVCQLDTTHTECAYAAEKILDLIQGGCRFRDIGVVCADMNSYKHIISMVFSRYKIPFYISGGDSILEKSVIKTVIAGLETVCGGFQQEDVLRYLKSPLSTLDIHTCDQIENYAITWNVNGNAWLRSWENHPEGLVDKWTDADKNNLAYLNAAREQALAPLIQLDGRIKQASCVADMVAALYDCLEQLGMAKRLETLSMIMESKQDYRSAQILNQLWDILLDALEQVYDVLGQTYWEPEAFIRLLKLLLSQYDVGTIPAVLDSVTVGSVSAMRCQRVKYMFVLGAVEGMLPSYGSITGVLTDPERTSLRQLGVPLTGGALDGLKTEFSEIYGVFSGAENGIFVTCPGGQPSFIYRRVAAMAGVEDSNILYTGAARVDAIDAASLLLQNSQESLAAQLGILPAYHSLKQAVDHKIGSVERNTITDLYGATLQLSASQIDKFADCKLSYFLKYGLRLKERKSAEVDPAEFGTYVHYVLENTACDVVERGGFPNVPLEEVFLIAESYSQQYLHDHFKQLDSTRLSYLFHRNAQELELIVKELWEELQVSKFQPIAFELAFGSGKEMEPIQIYGQELQAQLRGFVDRVDVWKENGRNYFRVIDYKTGKKDFDYCDVFNGLGLQMLLYLFALSENGQHVLGDYPVAAGVQYFPARAPFVSTEGNLDPDEADSALQKNWKRKGLLLNDETILTAMEPGDDPIRLPYTRKKDGSISGDLADKAQFETLKCYVYHRLEKMVDQIAGGNVEADPYTRGSTHNACAFCPFGAVCHPHQVDGRRDFKAMTAQRFWEEVEKEVSRHG